MLLGLSATANKRLSLYVNSMLFMNIVHYTSLSYLDSIIRMIPFMVYLSNVFRFKLHEAITFRCID